MAQTRAERNIAWIENYCVIPEGKLVGKPARLSAFQKKELKRIYDNPHGTRRAIISFARKNGKTALVAFLLLLHLVGPESVINSQLCSTAQARDQAAILFNLAAKVVRMSPRLEAHVTVRDTFKELECKARGTIYKALSAEAKTKHGSSPAFAVHDELGQVRGERSELYEVIETGMSAHDSPLSIIISTQAPNDNDLLSILIDDALTGADPQTVLCLYSSPDDLDPFDVETIKHANPAFGDFQNEKEILAMAENARRMPSREAEYRNLILNQRVEMNAPFITRSIWQACGGEVSKDWGDNPCYGALDLSTAQDLTAKVFVCEIKDLWNTRPTFWLPGHGLKEKAKKDRVPYDVWHEQGFLETTPSKTIEYSFVAQSLFDDCQRMNVKKIAFDRWGFAHLKPWLLKAGFTEEQIEGEYAIFVPFGQGFQSMSPALRDLESVIINEELRHGGHPVLSMCAANAVVTSSPAGDRKLDKSKTTGRIDGMVALTMAMSVAITDKDLTPPITPWDADPDYRFEL